MSSIPPQADTPYESEEVPEPEPCYISRLPDETLLKIFFEVSGLDAVYEKMSDNEEYRDAQRGCKGRCSFPSIKPKIALAKYPDTLPSRVASRASVVCSKWHKLFQEYVMVSVALDDNVDWSSLAMKMRVRPTCCAFHAFGRFNACGKSVKRILLLASTFDASKQIHATDILKECTELKELTFLVFDKSHIITLAENRDFLDRLRDACEILSKSLRVLFLSINVNQDASKKTVKAIGKLGELRVLCIKGGFRFDHFDIFSASQALLRFLHSVCCRNDFPRYVQKPLVFYIAKWRLPSLRFLHVRGGKEHQDANAMIQEKSEILRDVIIQYHKNRSSESLPNPEELRTVVLGMRLAANSLDNDRYPKLHYVGISGRISPFDNATEVATRVEELDEALETLTIEENFPSLQCIQLLDVKVNRLVPREWNATAAARWRAWVEMASVRGIIFVDKLYREISFGP